jgi:hypothetical protein
MSRVLRKIVSAGSDLERGEAVVLAGFGDGRRLLDL